MILGQASKTARAAAEKIYALIVAQSRQPFLYADYQVPDTIDGRFDAILLHASLVIHFLADRGESGKVTSQQLFDTMFRDFNHNLRQIGIGDMNMARHFRRMSEGFNGRLQAYAAAFNAPDQLVETIARNIYRDTNATPHAQRLAVYVRQQLEHLRMVKPDDLMHGQFNFAQPSTG